MSILKDKRTELRARKRPVSDRVHGGPTGGADAGRRVRPRAAEVQYLERLQAALLRIENGTYGICTQCGERISQDRLHADPSTALCTSCRGLVRLNPEN